MEHYQVLLILALVFGFYMAWNIGANDVANAMGTSVGSGALTLKRAVIIAAFLEFSGALFAGAHVSQTIRKGIVNPEIFAGRPEVFVLGMMATLLAAGAWLQIASYYGWPVSTTHSLVGAIVGFGAVVGGVHAVYWAKVGSIAASWVISPLFSGAIAFIIFSLLRRRIFYSDNPVAATKKITPFLVFLVFVTLTLVVLFKGLNNLHLDLTFWPAMLVAIGVGVVAACGSAILVARIKEEHAPENQTRFHHPQVSLSLGKALRHLQRVQNESSGEVQAEVGDHYERLKRLADEVGADTEIEKQHAAFRTVERIFVYLQILSACCVAFAHGANDVANAIGPLSAVISVLNEGIVAIESEVQIWVLALGGIGIVIGLATWGWRVIETIGRRITELTPSRGFSAEFGAAVTIFLASKFGIPVSTTHTLVGAVLGVGLARGMTALNLNMVRDIIIAWVVTIPAGAILAILFYYVLSGIF